MNNKSLFNACTSVLAFSTLLLCSKVYSHFPTLNCTPHQQDKHQGDKTKLSCQAGYSDASLAGVVKLKVYSYDEVLLLSVTTASDGSVLLNMPQGEYYIVFDPGHESPAEFDYAELQ